jgi:hypothetical protein
MITLTELSGKYGAPMGRSDEGNMADADSIAIEWMPYVDGDYDVGGAYWGGGEPMYCAAGYLLGDEIARCYIRAASRDAAKIGLDLYFGSLPPMVLPETGSIVKQTLAFLANWLETENTDGDDDVTADEISDLESWLEEKGLAP